MRKPLLVMITDTHLKRGNEAQIIEIFRQAKDKAIKLGLKHVYFVGDWFDSRKYQHLSTLRATIEILEMYEEAGITLRAIPGNHDKPDYKAEGSYLDVFKKYSALDLITSHDVFNEDGIWVHMIPFFDEKDSYSTYLESAVKAATDSDEHKHILLTHVAVNGVKNNDGSEMEEVVGPRQFTNHFDKTFIGHYHDYQELADGDIIYIGSTHQHNFGEDEFKGMTVLYDDLSIEQFRFETKQYKMVKIDLNTVPMKEVEDLIEKYEDAEDNVRFKFSGVAEKLKSIDKNKFKRKGIDVKVKEDAVDVDLSYVELVDFKGFDSSSIIEEWDDFTERKDVEKDMSDRGRKRLTDLFQTNEE